MIGGEGPGVVRDESMYSAIPEVPTFGGASTAKSSDSQAKSMYMPPIPGKKPGS